MADHNIAAAFIPLVMRETTASAHNAAHDNADLFTQDQSVSLDTLFSKNFYPKGEEHETSTPAKLGSQPWLRERV